MKYLQIIIRVFIILVVFLSNAVNVFGEVSSAFKPGNEDRILILNAYSGSSRWSNDFIIPIYNSYQHKNSPYVVDVEHMGGQFMHLQNAEDLSEYKENLFGKYADNPPKLLLLLGSASWGLLKESIEKQWKDVPVILCTETDYVGPQEAYLHRRAIAAEERTPLTDYQGNLSLTVFHVPAYLKETVLLMQNLMPEMDELIFLSDARYISAQFRSDLKEIVNKDFPELEIKDYVAGEMTTDELADSLAHAEENSGVLFCSWYQENAQKGNAVLTNNISRILSYYSSSPIFSLDNTGLQRNGMIGGYFLDEKTIGRNITEITAGVLADNNVKGVHMVNCGTPAPMFNYYDLTEAGLSPKLCPPNSVFYMMPPSFWLCRSAALPPLSPLRTVRATFTAYSSDNSKFSSHKTKSAHPPLMRVNFPIKFPFGTYVSGFLLSSASRSMLPKSGRKDWLHTSLLRVCKSVCLPVS